MTSEPTIFELGARIVSMKAIFFPSGNCVEEKFYSLEEKYL